MSEYTTYPEIGWVADSDTFYAGHLKSGRVAKNVSECAIHFDSRYIPSRHGPGTPYLHTCTYV